MSSLTNLLTDSNIWMDRRLLENYHTDYAYTADPPKDVKEWQERSEFVRSQVRLAAGLDPMPRPMESLPEITGDIRQEGCVIYKVKLQVLPDFFLTGNLYAPERVKIQAPGILVPHGHCEQGRLQDDELRSTPTLCMMLARLGFIVLSYDMLGYNDNNQMLHQWPENLRMQGALYGVSPFGLQTWSSLQALELLCRMDLVDERRIGIIGDGAGSLQTYTTALLDERIRVIASVGMFSSHYQGECYCENGPLLHLNGLTTFDLLCACAPKPLLLGSLSEDCTHLNSRYELPALRRLYALLDSSDCLTSFRIDGHRNFALEMRQRIYPWFTHWLLNQSLRQSLQEDKLTLPSPQHLRLFPKAQKPTEQSTQHMISQLSEYLCYDAILSGNLASASLRTARQTKRELVSAIINNEQNLHNISYRITPVTRSIPKGEATGLLVSRRDKGDIIPAFRFIPERLDKQRPACLLLAEEGKKDFFAGGNQATLLDMLMASNCCCLAADILGNGETLTMLEKTLRQPTAPLFYSFNSTLFSMRVQDILTLLTLMHEEGFKKIFVITIGNTLYPAMAALAISKPIYGAILDMEECKNEKEEWLQPQNFQPMIQKVGGLTGLAQLANVRELALYKPSSDMAEYVSNVAKQQDMLHLTVGRESFFRMVEYAVNN